MDRSGANLFGSVSFKDESLADLHREAFCIALNTPLGCSLHLQACMFSLGIHVKMELSSCAVTKSYGPVLIPPVLYDGHALASQSRKQSAIACLAEQACKRASKNRSCHTSTVQQKKKGVQFCRPKTPF